MSIANELITRGWNRGETVADDGSVCLTGAAQFAYLGEARNGVWESPLPMNVRAALWACIPADADVTRRSDGTPILFSFNDRSTYDEVLRVAKMADEILDAA